MWIKASGHWMAAALRDDIFVPLDLSEVRRCLREGANPSDVFAGASIETGMHATMPQRVVLHLHCVNTIAWAVRADGFAQLQVRLQGLRWHWLPWLPSGLPLARGMADALKRSPSTEVFVLGNHGLVLAAEDVRGLDCLLADVRRRLNVKPRFTHPADYAALVEMTGNTQWQLPDDDEIHALGSDPVSRKLVSGGILFPCQAIFSGGRGVEAFHSVWRNGYLRSRGEHPPFLIVEDCGVLVGSQIGPAELAMLRGLAHVTERLNASAPIRYLTKAEIADLAPHGMESYRELANSAPVR